MSPSTGTNILVETDTGHCHDTTLEALVESVRSSLAEKEILISRTNSIKVWEYIDSHHQGYKLFPHNVKAMSRLEINKKVFDGLFGRSR